MDADLVAAATDPTEHLIRALWRIAPVSRTNFKAPTFSRVGEVELFLEQFQEIASANDWNEKETLLHLRCCLECAAQTYGRGATTQVIFES